MTQPQLWLGGSFDPVHLGHLQLASSLVEQLTCKLWLLPDNQSAFGKQLAAAEHRLAMLRLAITDFPLLQLDQRELSCGGTSYTIDSLRKIRQEIKPDANLTFVLGVDALMAFNRWKDYQRILDYANLLILKRDHQNIPAEKLPQEVHQLLIPAQVNPQLWRNSPHGKVLFWHNPTIHISSTIVRKLIKQNQHDALQKLVSPSVFKYLCQLQPYS